MISFVVPAHNEEFLLGETLAVLRASAEATGRPFEIIVVDDASTDATARIAGESGATVLSVNNRQIAATRNAGARAARGETLVFVDADTHVPATTLGNALKAIDRGAVAAGAGVRVDRSTRGLGRALMVLLSLAVHVLRWMPGCFIVVRRDAFETIGGFDERYYATEEIFLSRALKRMGRLALVSPPTITSGRKIRLYPLRTIPVLLWKFARRGPEFVERRENLDLWYDGRRESSSDVRGESVVGKGGTQNQPES